MPKTPILQASIRSAYDVASDAYAQKFIHELDHKPLDRELLQRFASLVGPGRPVLDLGCGPGHTTAHLTSLGVSAIGVDLSPKMIEKASALFPQSRFAVSDFFALPNDSSSVAGILAFYCIVHLTPDQLQPAFAEMFRVLAEDGVLLLSFHVGSDVVRAERFSRYRRDSRLYIFRGQNTSKRPSSRRASTPLKFTSVSPMLPSIRANAAICSHHKMPHTV